MSPGVGDRPESVRDRYRSVARTLRERPWTLGVGWVVAIPAILAVGVGAGLFSWGVEALLPHLLLAVGLAGIRKGVFSTSVVAPDVVIQVTRAAFGLVGVLLAFEVVRAVVVFPATAAVYRIAEADPADGGTDLRGVARELVGTWRILLGGLVVRLAAFVAFALLLPVAVATYLALGTALEAVAWALDSPSQIRTWILVFSAVAGLVLVRRIATAAVWQADPDAVLDPDVGGRTAIRRSIDAFLAEPRRSLVEDVAASLPVVLVLVALLVVVAVGGTLDAGPTLLLVLAPVAVFGLATAIPTAALYRFETASSRDPPPDADRSVRDRLPLTTIAVAVLLVVSLGIAGGWVRTADVGLTAEDPTTMPNPVAADPGVAVDRSLDPVGRTSVETERSVESRTAYPGNGTTDPWRQRQLWFARSEPADGERVVVFTYASHDDPRRWTGEGVYQGELSYGRASVDYRADDPDPDPVLDARWGSAPRRPRPIPRGTLLTYNGNGSIREAEWRIVERTGDRIAYATTDRSMVTRFTDVRRVRDGRVRVWVERSTGRVRRIEARAARTAGASDGPGYDEVRVTVRVDGYGETEVRRPAPRGPFASFLDLLFYSPR